MMGQVENITRFGLFIKFSKEDLSDELKKVADKAVSTEFLVEQAADEPVSNKNMLDQDLTGLLRWSNLPKHYPKLQIGDFISVEIDKIKPDGKIDLSYLEKDFKKTYGNFLEISQQKMEELALLNKELLKK
jgi:predicted RNA-binding protein with RPS1 domain